ncbi:MAG: HPr family phosphocarrier protein [Chlamydiales bacterium]
MGFQKKDDTFRLLKEEVLEWINFSGRAMIPIIQKVRIKNPLGLHARPATVIAKLLQTSRSNVTFTYRKVTINPRSIMSILMLSASKNSQITITVEGEDANETLKKLVGAFETKFGE